MAEYSITNLIRTDKLMNRNGKFPINLRIQVKNQDTKAPTGIDIQKERWDYKKKEPKDKALLIQLNKRREDLDPDINRVLADGQE